MRHVLTIAICFTTIGCADTTTQLHGWGWMAVGGGSARKVQEAPPYEPGDEVEFEDLELVHVDTPLGGYAALHSGAKSFTASFWQFGMRGNAVLEQDQVFDGQTFLAGETIHAEYDLLMARVGSSWSARVGDTFCATLGASLQFLDFDLDLDSPSASGELEAQIPNFVVQVGVRIPISLNWSMDFQAHGLSYSRLLGIKEDFFRVRGNFLEAQGDVVWTFPGPGALRIGWAYFLLDLESADGDILKNSFQGPRLGLELQF